MAKRAGRPRVDTDADRATRFTLTLTTRQYDAVALTAIRTARSMAAVLRQHLTNFEPQTRRDAGKR
jgi:hypothetical protein